MDIFTPEARKVLAAALGWNVEADTFLDPRLHVHDDEWVWRLVCRAASEDVRVVTVLLGLFSQPLTTKMDYVQHVVPAINSLRDYKKS